MWINERGDAMMSGSLEEFVNAIAKNDSLWNRQSSDKRMRTMCNCGSADDVKRRQQSATSTI